MAMFCRRTVLRRICRIILFHLLSSPNPDPDNGHRGKEEEEEEEEVIERSDIRKRHTMETDI